MIVSQGDVHNLLENVIHFVHKLVCKRRDIFYPQPTHPLTHWWKLTHLDYITSQYMFDENLKCTFYRDNRKWKYWSAVNVLIISLSFGIHRQIFSFSIWEKHGNGLVWIKNTPTKSPIFSFVLFHHCIIGSLFIPVTCVSIFFIGVSLNDSGSTNDISMASISNAVS